MNISKSYSGLATKGFDVISSQFSLHYYFKNEGSLKGFIQNLVENIKKGGSNNRHTISIWEHN